MKFLWLNIVGWLAALSVVALGVTRSGSGNDTRKQLVVITATAAHPGTMSTPDDTAREASQSEAYDNLTTADSDSTVTASSNPAAVALNDSASQFMASGDFKRAAGYLKKALSLDDGYARAHYNLGIALQKQNKLGDAIKEYQRAVDIRPTYYSPIYNLGLLYYSISDFDKAREWLKKAVAVRKSEESAPAHYNLGLVYKHLGDLKASESSYTEALRLRPGYAEARYNLALLRMNDERYQLAVDDFEKAAALGMAKSKLFQNLGVCYAKLEDYEHSISAYRRALALDPNDPAVWFNLAMAFGRQEQADSSIAAYRRALELDPEYYQAHFNMAHVFSEQNQVDSALSHYRKAIELHSKYSKALFNMALLFSDREQYDSAAECYRKVVDLDPENQKALFNLGVAYGHLDKVDDAVKSYRELIDQDPVHEKGLNNLGSAFMKLEKYDSALVYFGRLVGLTHDAQAYFNRARAYRSLDSTGRAREDYQKAIEIQPEYAKAYHNLAILEEEAGDYPRAIELLTRAVDLGENDWKSHWKLGQIYVKLGMADQARTEYAAAAESHPQSAKFDREYKDLLKLQ